MNPQTVKIDGARLLQRLRDLGRFGALEGGGTNRLALSDADRAARDWTVAQMQALDMAVSVDAIGNVVATYAGTEALPPVMTGSHIDTVRTGGLYDGNYGVMAGLEVVATLRDAGLRPRRPIQVAFFTNEEGARFQPDMLGSLVLVGGLPLQQALAVPAVDNGARLGDELLRIGYAGSAPVGRPVVDSFVEQLTRHAQKAYESIELSLYADDLEKKLEKEQYRVKHGEKEDPLTGVLNSTYFDNKLKVVDGKQYYLLQDVYLVKREMSFSNRINYIWNVLIHKNK